MNINSDVKYKDADEAKSAVAQLDVPDDVKAFVSAEIDRIAPHVATGGTLRVFVALHDQQTMVHVHPFFEPVQAHS